MSLLSSKSLFFHKYQLILNSIVKERVILLWILCYLDSELTIQVLRHSHDQFFFFFFYKCYIEEAIIDFFFNTHMHPYWNTHEHTLLLYT